MRREARLPCVAISGSAPASVVFEVQRMGRDWYVVERVASPLGVMPNTLALLRYVVNDSDAAWRTDEMPAEVPMLDVVCSRSSSLEMTRCRHVERFDVAEPLQRLALLARLATLCSGQRAAGSDQRPATIPSRDASGPFRWNSR